MAINYELLNKGGISLGTNFELLSEKPLDSRLVVPSLDGLQNYIDNAAAYEGMIAYVTSEKKHYEVKVIDGVLSYRPFGLTEAELNDLITNATTAAMEFKGATATLPENPAKGDMYKVAGENINIKIDDVDAKLGDSIVYDGEKWFLIPSGDDIEDTWRPVEGVNNDATIKFADGDKTVAAVAADGTIKYNHATVAKPEDITDAEAGDLNTRTYITAVETDGYGHITGYKTATENVVDTNTEYTFESQVESSSVYFNVTPNTEDATEETIYVDAYSKNEADGKFVAKETGKSLLSDTEIARLADVDNYDDEEVRGLIGDNADAIDALSEYVGTIPNVPGEDGNNKYADLDVIGYINKKAQETLAAASGNSSETAASVKGQLDDYIGENNTRVKAVEDDIAAIKDADNGLLKQAQDYADGLAGNYDEAGAAASVQTALEAEIAKKVDNTAYEADKATFAIAETVNAALDLKANAADVVANDTFESFKTANTTAIGEARTGAVADVEAKGYAVASEVEATYATKTELGNVDKKFENYVTSASYATDKSATETALANRYTKEEADGKFALIADAYDDTALKGRMDTAEGKISDLETESAKHALKTELEAVDAKFADYTKTADLPTDLGDFTNNAGYAKTADVNAELDKKADKTQVTTDIANAIAPLATTEALNGVKATAEAAAVKADVDAALAEKADKSVVDAMYTNEQIDAAIAAEKERAELAETGLQTQINTIMNNPDTEGVINSINEFTQYIADHGEIAEGFRTDIDKNKEDIAANAQAIADETTRATGAEDALSGRIDELKASYDEHTHSWNDLTDKPFGEDIDPITWDGNTEGIKTIHGYYLVHEYLAGENFIGAVVTVANGESYTITEDGVRIWPPDGISGYSFMAGYVNGYNEDGEPYVVEFITGQDETFGDESGIGVAPTVRSITFPAKTLDDKYISSNIARTADVTVIDARVEALEGKVDVEKVSTAIADAVKVEADRATGVENGLAGRIDALETIDHDAYKAADAEVLAAAKADASNQDAVVLAEAQAYADTAKADAIADAEGKVNALAQGAVATNAGNIETLFEMFQWGEF